MAQSNELRGFVSGPRLVISDEEQLVLCTTESRAAAEQVLGEIGCGSYSILEESTGVPKGWVLVRGLRPKLALPVSPDGSILNVLRPQPDIEIVLEGGIRLQHSEWLLGFPPRIRVRGDFEEILLVDGRQAEKEENGIFVSPAWDCLGQHIVTCAGISRSYSIVQPEEHWEPWPAYTFPIGASTEGRAICGAATLEASSGQGRDVLWIPASNPVLLGAEPGEVFRFQHRTDVTTGRWPVSVPFDVVWALPADVLRADKRAAHVLLLGKPKHPVALPREIRAEKTGRAGLLAWALEILNSSRKGLSIRPASPELEELWRAYHRTAKTIWKASR